MCPLSRNGEEIDDYILINLQGDTQMTITLAEKENSEQKEMVEQKWKRTQTKQQS